MFSRLATIPLRHVTKQSSRSFAQRSRLNKLPITGTNTKIVCTLGPSSDTEDQVGALVAHGMNVARLNFSHAGDDYSYPEANMALVRNAHGKHSELKAGSGISEDLPSNVRAVLVDTKGPEIRTGPLPGNADVMTIPEDGVVKVTTASVVGEPEGTLSLNVDYQSIARTVPVGGQILLDDGLLALEVVEVDPDHEFVICKALNEGPIKKNKGVNLPGVELDLPALTEKDKRDLKWACETGADFVAASFIRTGANVRSVVAYLDRCIAEMDVSPKPLRPLVISKIESKEGVDNFSEILKESDGIMVARGDLGVEIPYSSVFRYQVSPYVASFIQARFDGFTSLILTSCLAANDGERMQQSREARDCCNPNARFHDAKSPSYTCRGYR